MLAGYSAWIFVFRLVILTFITFFVMSGGRKPRFEEVSDAFGATEVGITGLGALLFVSFLVAFYPITRSRRQDIITGERMERRFVPGFAQGAVFALGVVLAFLLSGTYRYLGFFVQFEGISLALVNVGFRVASLLLLVICEEFIFRGKILPSIRSWLRQIPAANSSRRRTAGLAVDLSAAAITSIAFCWLKVLQFDLGWMHLITLFIVSMNLAFRAMEDGDFARGAGFWAALLVVFHPLLSLPILGNEFSGVVLVKYASSAGVLPDMESDTTRILTGGAGGPLSSFALQLLLLFDLGRGLLRAKKSLLNPVPARLK